MILPAISISRLPQSEEMSEERSSRSLSGCGSLASLLLMSESVERYNLAAGPRDRREHTDPHAAFVQSRRSSYLPIPKLSHSRYASHRILKTRSSGAPSEEASEADVET